MPSGSTDADVTRARDQEIADTCHPPPTEASPLRWGILGPGRIAPRIVRGLRANARGQLHAVASRNADRARAFARTHAPDGSVAAYDRYEDLLADPAVDVVYVALPNGLHADWTVRALDAGKHVLCEKPLALTVAEVDAIAAAAERNGRIAVEAFMYLHHPQMLRALEVARSGVLGPLQVVSSAFSFLLDQPDDPRIDPTMGGGSLWDVGCYAVSVLAGSRARSRSISAPLRAGTSTAWTGPSSASSGSRAGCSRTSSPASRPPTGSAWRSSEARRPS